MVKFDSYTPNIWILLYVLISASVLSTIPGKITHYSSCNLCIIFF